jgi:5-methylcytosine-specific restriction endonuclease McrA
MSHHYIDGAYLCDTREDDRVRRREIFDAWDGECAYCGSPQGVTLDHIVPRKKGGGMEVNNLVPSCPHCNGNKGSKDLSEWYPRQRSYSPERMLKISIWRSEPWI